MGRWDEALDFVKADDDVVDHMAVLGERAEDAAWALAASVERRVSVRGIDEGSKDIEVMALSWCWLRQILPLPPKVAADLGDYMERVRPRLVSGASLEEGREQQRQLLGLFFGDDFLKLERDRVAQLLARDVLFEEGGALEVIRVGLLSQAGLPEEFLPPWGGRASLPDA